MKEQNAEQGWRSCTHLVSATPERLRQDDHQIKAQPSNLVGPCLKTIEQIRARAVVECEIPGSISRTKRKKKKTDLMGKVFPSSITQTSCGLPAAHQHKHVLPSPWQVKFALLEEGSLAYAPLPLRPAVSGEDWVYLVVEKVHEQNPWAAQAQISPPNRHPRVTWRKGAVPLPCQPPGFPPLLKKQQWPQLQQGSHSRRGQLGFAPGCSPVSQSKARRQNR